jgi:hypothetical protein
VPTSRALCWGHHGYQTTAAGPSHAPTAFTGTSNHYGDTYDWDTRLNPR